MKNFAALLILATLVSAPATAGAQSPSQVVQELYRWRIHPNASEIELNRQGETYKAGLMLFSKPLAKALNAQHAYQDACARLTPGMKPWMIDQDQFFLAPDGARALDSVTAKITGNYAHVAAHLSYDEYKWVDNVVLEKTEGRWAIVNIIWQDGYSLTKRLMKFAKYRCAL